MRTLPTFLRLNDARTAKDELFAGLSPMAVEILDVVAAGGSAFGSKPGVPTNGRIVLGRDDKIIEDGQRVLNALVKANWLRYSGGPTKTAGYFWMTDSSERLWRVLGRPVQG